MIHFKKKNCAWLMIALFLLLLLMPLVQFGQLGRLLMSLLATLTFLGGIGVVSDDKRHLILALFLMVPPLFMEWYIGAFPPQVQRIVLVPSFYHLPIYIFFSALILLYLFKPGRIKVDHLFGAICVYLLMGFFFAHLFVGIESLQPGSFQFPVVSTQDSLHLFLELHYFSFITLTSLGFGDITPVSMPARTLSIFEAIIGVLYIGALIARFAGSAAGASDDDAPSESDPRG